jgi:uncharacterized protein YodC (DUF2158 family)
MNQFQPGDRVRLRSGGPVMTVASAPRGDVKCFWFGSGDVLHEQNFPAVTLALVEAAPKPAAAESPEDGSIGRILAKSLEKQQQAAQQKMRRRTKRTP